MKINLKKKKQGKEEGQAAVEFALVLPLFLLLIFAIIEFGWFFYSYISVENSARNAARIACVQYLQDVQMGEKVLTYDAYTNDEYVMDDGGQTVLDDNGEIYKNAYETVNQVVSSSNQSTIQVRVNYAYDQKCIDKNLQWNAEERSKDDVTVTVSCDVKMLTGMFNPILRVNHNAPGHQNNTKTFICQSTFKVEPQHVE